MKENSTILSTTLEEEDSEKDYIDKATIWRLIVPLLTTKHDYVVVFEYLGIFETTKGPVATGDPFKSRPPGP